jgi:hypothetical protein
VDEKRPRKRNAENNNKHQRTHRHTVQVKLKVYEQLLADHQIDPSPALRKALASADDETLRKAALRKAGSGQTGAVLRKAVAESGNDLDEFLTEQRQHFDRVTDRYIKHAPKLEEANITTIRHKYTIGARDILNAWKNAQPASRLQRVK